MRKIDLGGERSDFWVSVVFIRIVLCLTLDYEICSYFSIADKIWKLTNVARLDSLLSPHTHRNKQISPLNNVCSYSPLVTVCYTKIWLLFLFLEFFFLETRELSRSLSLLKLFITKFLITMDNREPGNTDTKMTLLIKWLYHTHRVWKVQKLLKIKWLYAEVLWRETSRKRPRTVSCFCFGFSLACVQSVWVSWMNTYQWSLAWES